MKFSTAFTAICVLPTIAAFAPSAFTRRNTALSLGKDGDVIFGGNSWKPDSEKMGSTDTGDYFPEGYNPDEVAFTDGMGGSQASMSGGRDGPQLPGMENLGADAIMMGGIEEATDIPEGTEFIPSSVPDGQLSMSVAASGSGTELPLEVAPVCMTYEDFYAGFSANSHPSFKVSPTTGRMDRRGGETTHFTITCDPKGQAGTFEGDLVIILP